MPISNDSMKIVVTVDGPYEVYGGVPLVRKTQVVSEFGEPLTWETNKIIPTEGMYELCRCGQSGEMPFCDRTHMLVGFDGTETTGTGPTAERQEIQAGAGIVVKRDHSLCSESGFCGNRFGKIRNMVPDAGDARVRALIMAMIDHCPSGSFAFAVQEGGADIEPDLPVQIAVTTEIVSSGPLAGPLWVTGGVPVVRADGQPFEVRNRVTLCCCGESKTKPLCDGAHRLGK